MALVTNREVTELYLQVAVVEEVVRQPLYSPQIHTLLVVGVEERQVLQVQYREVTLHQGEQVQLHRLKAVVEEGVEVHQVVVTHQAKQQEPLIRAVPLQTAHTPPTLLMEANQALGLLAMVITAQEVWEERGLEVLQEALPEEETVLMAQVRTQEEEVAGI